MSISIEKLENGLWQVLTAAGTNPQVIIERPNAPRPELSYTGIRSLTLGAEQFDWSVFDTDLDEVSWYGFRELVYSVNCYGDNAMNEATRLQNRLAWPKYRDLLRTLTTASILSKGVITDLSMLMSEAFEKRATFDLFLLCNIEDGSSKETAADYFDHVAPAVWTDKP